MTPQQQAIIYKFQTLWDRNPSLSFMELIRLVSQEDIRANVWSVKDRDIEINILQRLSPGV